MRLTYELQIQSIPRCLLISSRHSFRKRKSSNTISSLPPVSSINAKLSHAEPLPRSCQTCSLTSDSALKGHRPVAEQTLLIICKDPAARQQASCRHAMQTQLSKTSLHSEGLPRELLVHQALLSEVCRTAVTSPSVDDWRIIFQQSS